MKVNIVTEGAWIKKAISDKLMKYNNIRELIYTQSLSPINDTDINFYICYNTYLPFVKSNVLDIGYVTHIHADSPSEHARATGFSFDRFKEFDFRVHQCKKSYDHFIKIGSPVEKNEVVYAPIEVSKYKLKKVTLGIVQNGEVKGKGLFFLEQLLKTYDFSNKFKFVICGRGWENVLRVMQEENIEYEYTSFTPEEYYELKHIELYDKMDFLLIPSLWEGGPMSILEAHSSGIQVISSSVGFAFEMNVEWIYKPGDIRSIINILNNIITPKLKLRNSMIDFSYENFNKKLYNIFTGVLNGRT